MRAEESLARAAAWRDAHLAPSPGSKMPEGRRLKVASRLHRPSREERPMAADEEAASESPWMGSAGLSVPAEVSLSEAAASRRSSSSSFLLLAKAFFLCFRTFFLCYSFPPCRRCGRDCFYDLKNTYI